MIRGYFISVVTLFLSASPGLAAQTAYVTDQLQIGLHADKVPDSPILKVIPTGTPVEIVKSEQRMSFVREPGGTSGWADNDYLRQDEPASNLLPQAESRILELRESLSRAEMKLAGIDTGSMDIFEQQLDSLNSQLVSERQRSQELLLQITELRNRLEQDNSNDSLFEKIDALANENSRLQNQLSVILEHGEPDLIKLHSDYTNTRTYFTSRNIIITLIVVLIAGVILGLYLMDIVIRRRHGGFRI